MAAKKITVTVPDALAHEGQRISVVPADPSSGPRQPWEPELVTAKDIGALLGGDRRNLASYLKQVKPYSQVGAGKLYRRSDIEPIAERLKMKRATRFDGKKHDQDCLRRRKQPGMTHLCSCGLADNEVAQVPSG